MTEDKQLELLIKKLSPKGRSFLLEYALGLRHEEAPNQPFYELTEEDEQAHARSMEQLRTGDVISLEESKRRTAQTLAKASQR